MIEILKITVICFVFWLLGEPGMIFNFWFRWIEGLPSWLGKPLGRCVICLTGQALFHYYWITHLKDYNLIDQLFYPAMGILFATILNKLYEAQKN
jgi:hypothetical protein